MVALPCNGQRLASKLLLKLVSLTAIGLDRNVLSAECNLELKISLAGAKSMQQNVRNDAIVLADKRRVHCPKCKEEQLLIRPRHARVELRTQQADVEFNVAGSAERSLTMTRSARDVVEQRSQSVAPAR